MQTLKQKFITAVIVTTLAAPAVADPKPRGSKPADGQIIANMYAGKTQEWKESCRGGIYYGGGGQAEAYCHKKGDAANVGIGTWSVTRKGKICAEMRWHWGKGEGNSQLNDKADCIHHVVDKDGQIWRRWDNDNDWWRFNADSVNKGHTLERKTNKLKRQFGL